MTSTTSRRQSAAPPRTPPLRWFFVGLIVAVFLQATQAAALGGWSGLLAVGETATLRPFIEDDLADLAVVEGGGHDGQIGYAIALDLDGSDVPAFLVDAGYRYRRILLPLLASLGGLLHGPPLLAGFVLLTALGMGMASAALESIRRRYGWSPWVHLAVLANPGLWMSVRLLTSDAVAFGFAALAVAAYLGRRWSMTVALAVLATLTKDQYVLVALSLAGHQWFVCRDRRAVATVGIPAGLLAAWAFWLQTRMEAGISPRGNLTWPGGGIISSWETWQATSPTDQLLVLAGLGAVAAGVVLTLTAKSRLTRWLSGTWVAIAAVSSEWVWTLGNNVVRVFAPLLALVMVAAAAQIPSLDRPPVTSTWSLAG